MGTIIIFTPSSTGISTIARIKPVTEPNAIPINMVEIVVSSMPRMARVTVRRTILSNQSMENITTAGIPPNRKNIALPAKSDAGANSHSMNSIEVEGIKAVLKRHTPDGIRTEDKCPPDVSKTSFLNEPSVQICSRRDLNPCPKLERLLSLRFPAPPEMAGLDDGSSLALILKQGFYAFFRGPCPSAGAIIIIHKNGPDRI